MEVRTCPTMKLLLLGLSLVLCIGVAEALRCHVCKYKIPLFGCFLGTNTTTCERREKCALVKTTLGALAGGFLGFPYPFLGFPYPFLSFRDSPRPWKTKFLLWMGEDVATKLLGKVTLYYQQGCTSTLNCGRERASDAESRLTSRYSCCETDLCNEEWGEEPTD